MESCVEGAFSQTIKTWRRHPALIGVVRVLSLWTNMKKITLWSLLVLIVMTSFLGCNAMRGAGTDIKNAGGKIENVGK